jgi:hypothetical protein
MAKRGINDQFRIIQLEAKTLTKEAFLTSIFPIGMAKKERYIKAPSKPMTVLLAFKARAYRVMELPVTRANEKELMAL